MRIRILSAIALIGLVLAYVFYPQTTPPVEPTASPEGRAAFELVRLADPATGEIPENIRERELAFARTLPRADAQRDGLNMTYTNVGPYNVGGRTRAFAIDKTNPNIYLAGAVSGGMWRSEDAGQTWTRTTSPEHQPATSCVAQDTRPNKTNEWYYGSGEAVGNSASKSFSAYYRGSGIYKSTDGGKSWNHLSSTAAAVNKATDWWLVFRVLVDHTRTDSTILLVANSRGIMRSNDGGLTWKPTLTSTASPEFSDIAITSDGVFYAVLSSDAGSAAKGIWRSDDGLEWTNITPSGFPASHERTVMAICQGNENIVWFLSSTPGSGTLGNSLWKYRYLGGNGSGNYGIWENRSSGLPVRDMNLYGGYCQTVAVKPDDEEMVFIGGTNLYRSYNGFQDTLSTIHIGGYKLAWDTNFSYRSGLHYPDQQSLTFHPTDPDVMISTNDGGMYRTEHAGDTAFQWIPLNNGYVSAQFYGIAMDHATAGSDVIIGGLQDRGTFWTNSANPEQPWVSARGSDGAYCWVEDGGEAYYMSTQYANIRKAYITTEGEVSDLIKVMPPDMPDGSGSGLLFVHPFTLDPTDNNTMYLPFRGQVWRNDNLAAADDEDLTAWTMISSVGGTITTIAASEQPQGVVWFGMQGGQIYRLDSAHNTLPALNLVSGNGITNGGYTSCIAIDPEDANKALVVYSNYNCISLWYTEDGGSSWASVEGNLKGEKDEGVPEDLYYISNGPSMRWAEIVHTEKGTVFFVGTSVGLFSTMSLDGENTEWKQEGAETIGNVVVDMLDYRAVDKRLVVGTHGYGIFRATVEFDASAGISGHKGENHAFDVFPNPASHAIHLRFQALKPGDCSIRILDMTGRSVHYRSGIPIEQGPNQLTIDLPNLPSASYRCVVKMGSEAIAKSIIVQQ